MAEHVESGSPTDNSATLTTTFSTTFDTSHSQPSSGHNQLDVTRDELERREMSHTVQLLRLEVSQKQLMIDALKNEQASEVEELREKLADAQHEKKLMKLRLQSMSHAFEKEIEEVRQRKREASVPVSEEEKMKSILVEDLRCQVEQAFDDVTISHDEYERLKELKQSDLAVSQLVKVRCYELTKPLHSQCNQLDLSVAELSQRITAKEKQLTQCQEKLLTVREEKAQVETRCCSLAEELASVRSEVQEGNYKINNFDSVKKDRDSLLRQVEKMKELLSEQEARESLIKADLDKSTKQCSSAEQTVELLRQDKDYLSRQVTSLNQRVSSAEEKADHLKTELSDSKLARETLYKQLISDKEKCKEDYKFRLHRELEELRSCTLLQMDQLKLQTKELYERENQSLCEARDIAITDRERAINSEKEIRSLHEQLLKNYHCLEASSERQSCELQAQLRIADFEKERLTLANQEILSQLKQCQLDREKLQKKVTLVSGELWRCQHESESTARRMEQQIEQLRLRMEGYEKIEKELDDIVLQSAQMEHDCDAERVLFSYGFGASVPTNSRRRLQQSVQLARRVLQLEKLNSSLRQQVCDEQSRSSELQQQLSAVEDLLSKTGQPQSYMVKSLREKDKVIKTLQGKVKLLERQLASSAKERAKLVETKNQMATDLEKLLNHKEELHHMKQVLVGVARQEQRPMRSDAEPAMHVPPPTLFTKRDQRKGQTNKSS